MYNKFTQGFLNQCHSETLAEESQNLMRYFATAQYDLVLAKFSVNMLYITIKIMAKKYFFVFYFWYANF